MLILAVVSLNSELLERGKDVRADIAASFYSVEMTLPFLLTDLRKIRNKILANQNLKHFENWQRSCLILTATDYKLQSTMER
jgi:hypothetical protein